MEQASPEPSLSPRKPRTKLAHHDRQQEHRRQNYPHRRVGALNIGIQTQGGDGDHAEIDHVPGDGDGPADDEAVPRGEGRGAAGHRVDAEGDLHQGQRPGAGAAEVGEATFAGQLEGGTEAALVSPAAPEAQKRLEGQGEDDRQRLGQRLPPDQEHPGRDAAPTGITKSLRTKKLLARVWDSDDKRGIGLVGAQRPIEDIPLDFQEKSAA